MNSTNEASISGGEIELQPQEIRLDDPTSRFRFNTMEKQLVATPGVIEAFGAKTIENCIELLQRRAVAHNGLDYLQVFAVGRSKQKLWVIEDSQSITALLPSEY